MPTRRQLIQKVTLAASASTVAFSGIPQTYSDLKLVVCARSDASDYGSWATFNPNGDTANVTGRVLYAGSSTALAASYSSGNVGYVWMAAALQTSNTFGNTELYLPNYSGSTQKSWTVSASAESNSATQGLLNAAVFMWNSTAPITSFTLDPQGSTVFIAGSTFYLYGITHVPIIRGGEVSVRGGFKYHTFKSTASLQVVEPGNVEYLVVAGGGGGAQDTGGGGGAGGYRSGSFRLSPGIKNIIVGSGGSYDTNGTDSSFNDITSTGGGAGGSGANGLVGKNGGSGGGGRGGDTTSRSGGSGNTPATTPSQGNNGGNNFTSANYGAGGGGGASTSGSSGSSGSGGAGGSGTQWLNGNYYSGGGAGGFYSTGGANTGGIGGGGSGGNIGFDGQAGLINTGGGGGGSGRNIFAGTNSGGSGIVIIRYPYDGN